MSHDPALAAPSEKNLRNLLRVTFTPVKRLLGASDIPTLHAVVQNTAPYSISILIYNSLLERAAGALGLVHLIDSSTGKEAPSDVVQFRRVWPPPRDAFVEIGPNDTVEVNIPLRTHKLEAGKSYDVVAKWDWQGLWRGGVDSAAEACSRNDTEGNATDWSRSGATTEAKMGGAFETEGS